MVIPKKWIMVVSITVGLSGVLYTSNAQCGEDDMFDFSEHEGDPSPSEQRYYPPMVCEIIKHIKESDVEGFGNSWSTHHEQLSGWCDRIEDILEEDVVIGLQTTHFWRQIYMIMYPGSFKLTLPKYHVVQYLRGLQGCKPIIDDYGPVEEKWREAMRHRLAQAISVGGPDHELIATLWEKNFAHTRASGYFNPQQFEPEMRQHVQECLQQVRDHWHTVKNNMQEVERILGTAEPQPKPQSTTPPPAQIKKGNSRAAFRWLVTGSCVIGVAYAVIWMFEGARHHKAVDEKKASK